MKITLLARVQLLRHFNLVQKPFPKRQAIHNSDAKAAVDKEWGKLKNLQAWEETQVKSKKWSSSRHNKRVKDWLRVHFIDVSAEPRWYHALPKRHTLCRDPSMSNVIWFCAQSLFLVTRPSEAYGTQHPLCVQHLVLGAASYSDATDLLERFEASAVSQSLHGKTEYQVHFSTLMHSCHLKNSIECKGRVVFRGDVVKDDSGSCAVSTEQGSSASHMTAAKVLNVIARLLWGAGQASEMVSLYTPGKTEDASKLLHLSDKNVPLSGFGHRDISGQKLGKTFKILLFLLTGICTDTWDSSKRFYSKMDRSGTACWCIDNKDSFFPLTWTTSRGQGPSRSHVEKIDETSWSWETNATSAREAPWNSQQTRVYSVRWQDDDVCYESFWKSVRQGKHKGMDDVALENNTTRASKEERERNRLTWIMGRNTDGSAPQDPLEIESSRFSSSFLSKQEMWSCTTYNTAIIS